MPKKDNPRYIADLAMGEKGEQNAQPLLEKVFGRLERTKYKYNRFDFTNEKSIIELKTRSCKHNAFDRDGGLMFNYSKIEKYENSNEKRKVFFAFNCIDGLYYWEYNKDTYTKGIGGRKDRGCIEMREMAKVLSKDMICIYKTPNPFDGFLLASSDEED
tara:strand:+ start:1061 stop:1537 length:477 start_codon:yes stop_codon:yes gene_type:complete